MLGSNRPSDSQVEGCVEALSFSRCPRGEVLLGDVFQFASLPENGVPRITSRFSAYAIVSLNNRVLFSRSQAFR